MVTLDAAGNTTSNVAQNLSFGYGDHNRMLEVYVGRVLQATYVYNGQGQRVRRVEATGQLRTFVYHYGLSGELLGETVYDQYGARIGETDWTRIAALPRDHFLEFTLTLPLRQPLRRAEQLLMERFSSALSIERAGHYVRASRVRLMLSPDAATPRKWVMALVRCAALAAVGVCTVSMALAQGPQQSEADSAREKLDRIVEYAERRGTGPAPPRRTTFSEDEINAYLAIHGVTLLPDGITDPRIRIGEGDQVTARGIVDLDAVRRSRERAWHDPLAYATGSVEVVATGVISSADGRGVAKVESVTLGGLTVPQTLLEELLQFYTRTPERPQGFDLDEPFALPARIRSLRFEPGRVTATQ